MFISGVCDIEFLCSNMRIKANKANYNIALGNHDFETQVERHEDESQGEEGVAKSSWVNENVYTCLVRIRFLCSNMRIEINTANYDIELVNHDFETQDERHEENSKVEEGVAKSTWVN